MTAHGTAKIRPYCGSTRLLDQCAGQQDGLAATLFDDALGPCLLIDASWKVVRGNQALCTVFPFPLAQPGSDATQLFAPDGRQLAIGRIAQVLAGKIDAVKVFSAVLGGLAEPRAMQVIVLPLRERSDEISGAFLRFTDDTAQRKLEEQLAHSQKLHVTGQLAGGIAHDFNNVLSAILGGAESIIERGHGGETAIDAAQIRDSAHRGTSIVRQLLAFGRQHVLRPQVLAVNDAIASVSGLLQRLLGAQIRLVVELEQPERCVLADPTQLDQVLVNLIVNARDAMPAGGDITLRSSHITVYRPHIASAETIPPGRYVIIEIQDRGAGISADALPHIFEPFFTTKLDQGGSGLGLPNVQRIVSQANGYLTVDTKVDVGTTMRIFLPRWDGPAPLPPDTLPKPAPANPKSRGVVLLADDDDPVRRLAQRALVRAGWDVIEAESGEAALNSLRLRPAPSPQIAALVSDMVMPGMPGLELANLVRIACARPSLPVIFVSGYAEPAVLRGLDQINTHFLAKPYRLVDLVARLAHATSSEI